MIARKEYSDKDDFYKQFPDCAGRLNRDWNKDVRVAMRPFDADDTKFVMHSWMRSLRVNYRDTPDVTFYENMTEDIKAISRLPDIRVIVACDYEQPWFIMGYCAARPVAPESNLNVPLIVYYCFVKAAYRRRGIGRALLQAMGHDDRERLIVSAYWPYVCRALKGHFRMQYDPWVWREGAK